MATEGLSRVRKSVLPQPADTWSDIAARELPDMTNDEAVSRLQSWNLHVFMRANVRAGQATNPILPSDVIFVEPPQSR